MNNSTYGTMDNFLPMGYEYHLMKLRTSLSISIVLLNNNAIHRSDLERALFR